MTNILLIEDEEHIARAAAFALEQQGYSVRIASSAGAARKALAAGTPDLILLDVSLGLDDGLVLCKALRADKRTQDTPLILLSGYTSPASKTAGLAAGADDYITKPFVPDELAAHITTMLRRSRQGPGSTVEDAAPGQS